MATLFPRPATGTALCLMLSLPAFAGAALAQDTPLPDDGAVVLDTIVLTAEEQAKQALGASTVTGEDLARQPVKDDISEIVRKMPGVNLTGSTATGQRGNQRQIDIRGMGPENTLILIDGKPVMSRNAVKMSRGGERDSRGDSGWVPPSMIERVEVLRGPAAARYGSGASGGVVNIITKRPDTFGGQVTMYTNQPENSKEGATNRASFMLGGPLGQSLSFRVMGNYSDTEGDAADLNPPLWDPDEQIWTSPLAGSEGVVSKDLGALVSWTVAPGHVLDFEASVSRQGNEYAGDTRNGAIDDASVDLVGSETSRMYRRTYALTHRGEYDFGESNSYIQWENTHNTRLCSGTAGRVEDNYIPCIDTDGDGENDAFRYDTIVLDTVSAKSEWILPLQMAGKDSRVTFGAEYRGEFMDDPFSITNSLPPGWGGGTDPDPENRDPKTHQNTIGLYAEANIEWNDSLTLTPGLRYDHNDNFGSNWSPSLNATYRFNDAWTMKVGVARAFKVPNLFQLNPNYVYTTRGNGCPWVDGVQLSGPCYVLGNPDLEPERSVNKEIGVAYAGQNGVEASLTYFHNDYDSRIGSGFVQYNDDTENGRLFRWENQGKAVISGLEGNFSTELGERFAFNANFTKMIKSEKDDGQPLSLVPEYTINASLDWYATPDVTVTLSATQYGKIKAASMSSITNADFDQTNTRDPYTLVNLGSTWQMNDSVLFSAGVTNLFDKTVLRTDSSTGANTFNEPGRAFYMSLTSTF